MSRPCPAQVEFEHHFRGAWATTDLAAVVADLADLGFDCYLQGAMSALWRLSNGCFDANLAVKAWSNVACVRRDELAWHALMEAHAVQL